MAMNNSYGMPVDDSQSSPGKKDTGSVNDGLTQKTDIKPYESPMKEQARFAAGERNENLPGGFKFIQ